MKIRVDNAEFEFLPEDLRHFKLDTAKDVADFIKVLKKDKSIGFRTANNKKDKM